LPDLGILPFLLGLRLLLLQASAKNNTAIEKSSTVHHLVCLLMRMVPTKLIYKSLFSAAVSGIACISTQGHIFVFAGYPLLAIVSGMALAIVLIGTRAACQQPTKHKQGQKKGQEAKFLHFI